AALREPRVFDARSQVAREQRRDLVLEPLPVRVGERKVVGIGAHAQGGRGAGGDEGTKLENHEGHEAHEENTFDPSRPSRSSWFSSFVSSAVVSLAVVCSSHGNPKM